MAEPKAYIAIIIDDLGNNKVRGERAINLPGQVTYAVLPHSRYAQPLAEEIYLANKEVIVHLPMENRNKFPMAVDALTDQQEEAEFIKKINTAIDLVPHARGINNHQGSYLTQKKQQMNWLMAALKPHNFFFLDSRTSPKTVAYKIAKDNHILSSSRDIFLDNQRTHYEIDRAFQQLIHLAKRRGTAIAIGHPHKQTLEYLELAIPLLRQQGVELLPVSNLMALQQIRATELAVLSE